MPNKNVTKKKPIDDITRPGQSPPPATSKPVIITNRSVLKDPMMVVASSVDEAPNQAVPTVAKEATTAKSASLEPLKAPLPSFSAEVAVAAVSEEAHADIAPPPEKTVPAPPEPTASLADDANVSLPTDEAKAEAAADREKQLQGLVDNRRYFLSINAIEKRRTKRFIILGITLSVVLAIAWVDIALDASIIHVAGLKPVTHLFSN